MNKGQRVGQEERELVDDLNKVKKGPPAHQAGQARQANEEETVSGGRRANLAQKDHKECQELLVNLELQERFVLFYFFGGSVIFVGAANSMVSLM